MLNVRQWGNANQNQMMDKRKKTIASVDETWKGLVGLRYGAVTVDIHGSIFYNKTNPNIQYLEQLDKQKVAHPHNGMLLNLKRKRNSNTCYHMDEP